MLRKMPNLRFRCRKRRLLVFKMIKMTRKARKRQERSKTRRRRNLKKNLRTLLTLLILLTAVAETTMRPWNILVLEEIRLYGTIHLTVQAEEPQLKMYSKLLLVYQIA